jgi:hypothetical protein
MVVSIWLTNVNVPKGLSALMDRTLTCLHETIVEITAECGESASIELSDYATLFL